MRPKIALIQNGFVHGGVGRLMDNIIYRLGEMKFRLFSLNYHKTGYFHLDSTDVVRIPLHNKLLGIPLPAYLSDYLNYSNMLKAIRAWSPDLVVVNKGGMEVEHLKLLSEGLPVPTVAYFHNLKGWMVRLSKRRKMTFTQRALTKLLKTPSSDDLGACGDAICVSLDVERDANLLWPKIRTYLLYNGVDHSKFFPTWEDDNYLLAMGRISHQKRFHFLINALKNTSYKLVIIGSFDSKLFSDRQKRYYEYLGSIANANVKIILNPDEATLLTLLRRCSIFLHAGYNEGFGLATLEAMACGKPVIAHKSGATPEVLGQTGYLLDYNPADWLRKVDELMASSALRREIGKLAYERSLFFDWNKTALGFKEIINKFL
ncbi:MAG: glycosyltransferase family 4 protein [Conexivisphaerales archaeon]